MVYGFRYIQIDETGLVTSACSMPVEGVTIDTEGMTIPEQPTDAHYALYYNEEQGLHYEKVADFEEETTEPTQLDRIENNLALLTEDTAEYKAFYEAAKEILPEGSDA